VEVPEEARGRLLRAVQRELGVAKK
jgi:hypothetical protein